MRTQTLPTLTTVEKTGASLVGDHNARSRSPLAEYATALLRARVDKGRISTTTFDLYVLELESLVDWVATQGIAWGTTASEVACDAWAVAPSSPTQRRVRTTLLCELTGWEHVRRSSRLVTGRAASSSAELVPLSLDHLKHIHRRAVDIIARIESHRHAGTATECWLLRSAFLAMARFAAARASDLAAVTLGDITGADRARWTAARSRRDDGRATLAPVTLHFPPQAREPVERYLEYREAQGFGVHEATTRLFRRPGGGTLHRSDVHEIVSGLYAESRLPNEIAQCCDASSHRSYAERCILDQPLSPDAATFDGKLSPALLWHCAAVSIVSRHGTFNPNDLKAVGSVLGCHVRRVTARYRDILEASGWQSSQPYPAPRASTGANDHDEATMAA